MKNKINLLFATLLILISFSFTSCEPEPKEIEAKYTYLSDIYPDDYTTATPGSGVVTCIVNGNSLMIKKTRCFVPYPFTDKPPVVYLDVTTSNDTIYLNEKWYNTGIPNGIQLRDENILMTNIPKGRWNIKNMVTAVEKREGYTINNIYTSTVFSVEIK